MKFKASRMNFWENSNIFHKARKPQLIAVANSPLTCLNLYDFDYLHALASCESALPCEYVKKKGYILQNPRLRIVQIIEDFACLSLHP